MVAPEKQKLLPQECIKRWRNIDKDVNAGKRKLQKETNHCKVSSIFQTCFYFLQIIGSSTGKMCGYEKKVLTVPPEYIYYFQSAFMH